MHRGEQTKTSQSGQMLATRKHGNHYVLFSSNSSGTGTIALFFVRRTMALRTFKCSEYRVAGPAPGSGLESRNFSITSSPIIDLTLLQLTSHPPRHTIWRRAQESSGRCGLSNGQQPPSGLSLRKYDVLRHRRRGCSRQRHLRARSSRARHTPTSSAILASSS